MRLYIDGYQVNIEACRIGDVHFNKDDTIAFLNLLSLCLGYAGRTEAGTVVSYISIAQGMSSDIYEKLKGLGVYGEEE